MKKFIGLILSLALLPGVLAGYAGVAVGQSKTTPGEAAWPRTIKDALGKQIVLAKKPVRVALLDFGYIEILLALNIKPIASIYAERSLNGFGTLQPYAANTQIEELGEGRAPNLEKLAELGPDIILYTAEARNLDMKIYEAASKIAPVVTFNIPDWKEQLRAFAACLGEEKKAEAYIANIEALIAESRQKLAGYSSKTVAIMFERGDQIGGFVIIASAENPVWFDKKNGLGLTPPNGYPKTQETISLEGVAAMNPDYIFLCGTTGTKANGYKQSHLSAGTQASSVWKSLKAVKNGHVYYLDAAVRPAGPLGIKLGIETIVASMTK